MQKMRKDGDKGEEEQGGREGGWQEGREAERDKRGEEARVSAAHPVWMQEGFEMVTMGQPEGNIIKDRIKHSPELGKDVCLQHLKPGYILWAGHLFLSIKFYLNTLRLFIYTFPVAASSCGSRIAWLGRKPCDPQSLPTL